jgi:16S rRNA (guanine527-N7)-methyltransferase
MNKEILKKHRELLHKWRKAMDLIGPGDMELHFQDSIEVVNDLDTSGSWVDLGSGAGFPGIALAAYHPDTTIQLVESRQKRTLFLKRVIAEAGLKNVNLYHGRTENISQQFDGVISRAYKPPLEYLKDAQRLCKPGGVAICLLGEQGNFSIPEKWTLQEEKIYKGGSGRRKRWTLLLSP